MNGASNEAVAQTGGWSGRGAKRPPHSSTNALRLIDKLAHGPNLDGEETEKIIFDIK